MPPSKDKEVWYDIRPVKESGQVNFDKINLITKELNLKRAPLAETVAVKEDIQRVFQEEVSKDLDMGSVLADVGATLVPGPSVRVSPRRGWLARSSTVEPVPEPQLKQAVALPPDWSTLAEVAAVRPQPTRLAPRRLARPVSVSAEEWPSPISREIETMLGGSSAGGGGEEVPVSFSVEEPMLPPKRNYWHDLWWVGVAVAMVVFLVRMADRGQEFKDGLIEGGHQAADKLKEAKTDLAKFDFASAANNFTLAYDNFSQTSSKLDLLGASFTSFLSEIPGFKKIKTAKNILKAGENISKAGETLAFSLDNLYRTNFVSYFGFEFTGERDQSVSASYFIALFRDAALFAEKRLGVAQELLAQVAESTLPVDKQKEFIDLRAQVPLLKEGMGRAVDYSDFLLEALGQSSPKKYILLFQNNTELRPAGGFPGSYALMGFNRGFLRDFKVDDIYNIDGQARKNIVPPVELRHITPTWGMRDANWFVNFPDSARKVMQMYTENDGGPEVDGVITITPTVIAKILEVLGSIELPEYNLILDQNNFLAEIQEEVEYGENRVQPKQVLVDFTPKFIEKLGQQDKEQWFKIVRILLEGTEQKHVLAYFKDPALQKVAEDNDFAGLVKKTDADYLLVTHSNVKGSKTDAVIDNRYELQSSVDGGGNIEHTLIITRAHRGGKTAYGFYNRPSFDYLRVLVPQGSTLLSIQGQSRANFAPLIRNYSLKDYAEDEDLKKYEEDATVPLSGVKQFEEAGKTVFGFWLFLQPGETKSVAIKYKTPVKLEEGEYLLMVQKQPGTPQDDFQFSFSLPDKKEVIFRYPELQVEDRQANFQTKLAKDLIFGIKLQ